MSPHEREQKYRPRSPVEPEALDVKRRKEEKVLGHVSLCSVCVGFYYKYVAFCFTLSFCLIWTVFAELLSEALRVKHNFLSSI